MFINANAKPVGWFPAHGGMRDFHSQGFQRPLPDWAR